MIEKTFVMLKPDAVQRQITGRIIQRFENTGLKIVGMKMRWIDKEFSKKHYKDHVEKSFFKGLDEFVREGPVIAIVIEGINAIENVRRIVGSTEPKSAQPGTIRGDFAHVSYSHADKEGKAVKNLIHASGNKEDAEYEINLWFKPEEIHTYKTVHEQHVF